MIEYICLTLSVNVMLIVHTNMMKIVPVLTQDTTENSKHSCQKFQD